MGCLLFYFRSLIGFGKPSNIRYEFCDVAKSDLLAGMRIIQCNPPMLIKPVLPDPDEKGMIAFWMLGAHAVTLAIYPSEIVHKNVN
jgi:hypothetical protein